MGNRLTQPGYRGEAGVGRRLAEAVVGVVDGSPVGRRRLFGALLGGGAVVLAGCGNGETAQPVALATDRPTSLLLDVTPSTAGDPLSNFVHTEHGYRLRPGEGTYVFPGVAQMIDGDGRPTDELFLRPILNLERHDLGDDTNNDLGKLAAVAFLDSEGAIVQQGGLPLEYWLNGDAEVYSVDQRRHDAFSIDDVNVRMLNFAQYVTLEGQVSGVEGPVHTFLKEYTVDDRPPVEQTVESLMSAGAFGLRVSGVAVPSSYHRGVEMVLVGQ